MPQEIVAPIASPRSGGYKPGDEVTVGGQSFSVIGTNQDGLPLLAPKDGFKEDGSESGSSRITTPIKSNAQGMMAKIISKRDKIMELPDGVRETVLEKLFDKAVGSKIPKAMNDQQRQVIRQRFVDSFLGKSPSADPGQSPEDSARAGNMPHGAFGVGRAGLLEGLSNMLRGIRHEGYKLHYGDKGSPEGFDNYANKGLVSSLEQWFKKQAEEQRGFTKPYEERSKPHNVPLLGPVTRADVESGAGKTLSSLPLDLATAELIPGAKGAKLTAKILSGAGKGAVAGGVTAPSFGQKVTTGMTGGAAVGGVLPLVGAPFSRGAKTAVAKAAKEALPGVAENASSELEKLAQEKFKKPLTQLSPDEKIKLVNDWRDASVSAAKEAKVTAKKNAAQAKIDAVTAKATAKVDERVAVRKAMDEAKALQKRITEFVRTNKRAPNADELVKLKEGVAAEAPTAPAKAAAPTEERGIKKPERRTFLRTETKDVKDYYRYRFDQLRDELKGATTPEEKADVERRMKEMEEVQKLHPTSMGDVHDFKVESPEAIKAVAAVADVSKVAGGEVKVTKVPEGASGLSSFQQTLNKKLDETTSKLASATDPKVASQLKKTIENIKSAMGGDMEAMKRLGDAERKAAERERAAGMASASEAAAVTGSGKANTAVAELVSSSAATPEEALLKAEEEFYDLTDRLEATGGRGKEIAKKLNEFWKKPPKGMSRQQVIEAGEKAFEQLKGGQ